MRRRFALTALAAIACSTPASTDAPDPDLVAHPANPEGVSYPTDHVGVNARVTGRPGDRIANFTFQGYVDSDRSRGLQTISLADYFDPTAAHHKILNLQAAATWCAICGSEADATVSVKDALAKEGIVFLEVVVAGPSAGLGPSLDQFDSWMRSHATNFSIALDVRARRLGVLGVSGSAVPWNSLIDTRTMEILNATTGAPDDIVAYTRLGTHFVDTHPPSY